MTIDAVAATRSSTYTHMAPSPGADDAGFASTLSAVNHTATTQIAATASSSPAASTVLGSPGWFDLLYASPQEEQSFATDLTRRLQAAGVDTSQPIALSDDAQGHVKAKDGTPDKAAIDAVFASDPTLENTYKKIANTEETTAMAQVYQSYSASYAAAGSNAARGSVWQQYSGDFQAIAATGGDLTLVNGSLQATSAATG